MPKPSTLTLLVCALAAGCGGAATPSTPSLRLNEVQPSNATGCVDEAGEADDWIELYNAGDADLDLAGYSLSDDASVPLKSRFGAGLTVPAGAVLLLWADDSPEQGTTHLPFKLNAEKERALLYDPDGVLLDSLDWKDAPTDHSYARSPDGSGGFVDCATPSCGALDACGQ